MLGPLIIDLKACEIDNQEAQMLQDPLVGGVILFSRNYDCPAQLQQLCAAIRKLRPEAIIAVDQEGGRVQRFKNGFTALPALQKIGRLYETDPSAARHAARELAWLMAAELRVFDIDISFAPVLDVDDCKSDVIGDRSFANNPDVVAELAEYYIEGLQQAGMAATLKHFPGHGSIKTDSHLAAACDDRSLDELRRWDLVPFIKLLPRAQAVMPAHIQFQQVDQNCVGFSQSWLQQILRSELSFNGVIFSDDLSMQGAAVAGDHIARASAALSAGCDAILLCNQPQMSRDVLEWLHREDWQANNKLFSLRARPLIQNNSLAQLQQLPRWQQAKQLAKEINGL